MAMDMRSMVAALATLDEGSRRTMMRERLAQFASLADAERSAAMRQMMEALGTLGPDDVKKLVVSRTEALGDLPDAARATLIRTHLGLLSQAGPERAKAEMDLVREVMPQLSATAQQAVQQMMQLMVGSHGGS